MAKGRSVNNATKGLRVKSRTMIQDSGITEKFTVHQLRTGEMCVKGNFGTLPFTHI